MVSRLVVGCGSFGHALVEALSDRPGQLRVVSDSERRVEQLREEGIAATMGDTTDPETLSAAIDRPDTVVVAADSGAANLAAARAAREVYPDAFLLTYAGFETGESVIADLHSLANRVVDASSATGSFLLDRAGDDGLQLRRLRHVLRTVEEPLAIVTHDNPDPDAIASAVALKGIAEELGVTAEVCYYGRITHQENRAFINLLEFDLRRLDPESDLSEYGGFALVDHSRPGVNDQLPEDTVIDIVIDHHPPRAPVDARFVDLRSDVGATSTLLVEYLDLFSMPIEEAVATGLLFGIRIDTKDFSREVSVQDFDAAAKLLPHANVGTLERIESPSISGETFETIARAIRNQKVRGSILTSFVGEHTERDALAQAADRLLDIEGINATIVYGISEGVIYISGRARGIKLDLGETLREAFDQIGSAGGHADMAGAQIQMEETTLDVGEDGDAPPDIERFITERFYEALETRPTRERIGLSISTAFSLGDAEW